MSDDEILNLPDAPEFDGVFETLEEMDKVVCEIIEEKNFSLKETNINNYNITNMDVAYIYCRHSFFI